jgi:hypothetical protein
MAALYNVRFEKRITVQCYAGYKGDERPTAFELAGRTLQILEIADRWYDPDSNYFKVVAEDGARYLLRHDLNSDLWGVIEDDQNG